MNQVLWHLRENESRRLFAARGFSSLWEYATKELGYSEGAASRRIGAMRLLQSLPAAEKNEIEEALKRGQVSLSTLSSVQRFCRAEQVPVAEKIEIVKQTLGKSQRETDRLLATLSPEPFKVEKTRPLSDNLTELRITLNSEQLAKLQRAKEILSNQAHSWAEVFEVLAEQLIERSEPKVRDLKKAITSKSPALTSAPAEEVKSAKTDLTSAPQVAVQPGAEPTSAPKVTGLRRTSRYIPLPLKRQKFAAAQHQCEYVDPESKRRCAARDHLEMDHIQPFALGGATSTVNLRVLCRAHNQFHALKCFGPLKMESFWQSKR